MPLQHKIVRAPLRLLSRVIPEPRHQSVVLPYWYTLVRLAAPMRTPPPAGVADRSLTYLT